MFCKNSSPLANDFSVLICVMSIGLFAETIVCKRFLSSKNDAQPRRIYFREHDVLPFKLTEAIV